MALVSINEVRTVRTTHDKWTKAYILDSRKKVDPTTVISTRPEINIDGNIILLDSGEGVHRAIKKGGFFFFTDDTGKATLGF